MFLTRVWLLLICFLPGCLAHEPELGEPRRTEEAQPVEHVAAPAERVVDSTMWVPEDFPFVLYRQIVGSREATENVVISPVTALIEMDAIARESEPDVARGIAERLGFSGDVAAMNAHIDGLVAELEARRLREGRFINRRGGSYEILEEDEERLRGALRIEWLSFQRRSSGEKDRLEEQLADRSDGFLSGKDFAIEGQREAYDLRAMLFVGQSVSQISRRSLQSGEFRRPDGEVTPIEIGHRSFSPALTVVEDGTFMELALLGNEISLFLLLPAEDDELSTLEERLTAALIEEWIEGLTSARVHYGDLPLLDLRDFIDLSPHFEALGFEEVPGLNRRLLHPSRFVLGREGVNHPEPVRIASSPGGMIQRRTDDTWGSFDRPFLFFLYDRPSSTVLLMGRVASP